MQYVVTIFKPKGGSDDSVTSGNLVTASFTTYLLMLHYILYIFINMYIGFGQIKAFLSMNDLQ